MNYLLYIRGLKDPITIDDKQKDALESAINDSPTAMAYVGKSLIKLSEVKSIISIEHDGLQQSSDTAYDQKEKEWIDQCVAMGNDDIKTKVDREIDVRIRRGLQVNHVEEYNVSEIQEVLKSFFAKNPLWPRCPSAVWWPYVKDLIQTKATTPSVGASLWWEYVIRNDTAIFDFMKRHHRVYVYKKPDIQQQLPA